MNLHLFVTGPAARCLKNNMHTVEHGVVTAPPVSGFMSPLNSSAQNKVTRDVELLYTCETDHTALRVARHCRLLKWRPSHQSLVVFATAVGLAILLHSNSLSPGSPCAVCTVAL